MKKLLRLLSLLIFTCLSACSYLSQEPLEIQLANILFTNATLFETSLQADIRYENPNENAFKVVSAVHRLALNGVDVGKGFHRKAFTVPAYGTVTEQVDFRLSNISLATKAQKLINSNTFEYQVTSKIKTTSGSFSVVNEGTVLQ
jgi:LEA14-like dessication related protein